MKQKLTIFVSGTLCEVPQQGGLDWVVLHYLLGLKRLGHHVVFIEPIAVESLKPQGCRLIDSANARYFLQVLEHFGFADTSSLVLRGTCETVGLEYDSVRELARSADVFLNISGRWVEKSIVNQIPIRVYLDLDPVFTQLWQAAHGIDMNFDDHTHYFTVGHAIGRPHCNIPTCGRSWIVTNPPVVLENWPKTETIVHDGLTTIANWRGYGSVQYQGVLYGQKAHSLRPLIDLPTRCREQFILALRIHPDEKQDLAALTEYGWQLLDPDRVADSPWSYQQFVRGSKAEFGIAKSGYVVSQCGWFSDRSVCYLASGRPVVAQDTGFSRYLPTGQGLLTFKSSDELSSAVEKLRNNYGFHAEAARRMAEEHFDSDIVLLRLLQKIGAQ